MPGEIHILQLVHTVELHFPLVSLGILVIDLPNSEAFLKIEVSQWREK